MNEIKNNLLCLYVSSSSIELLDINNASIKQLKK